MSLDLWESIFAITLIVTTSALIALLSYIGYRGYQKLLARKWRNDKK